MRNPKETIYTDQTGAFPITAQSRTRYVMAMITIDANAILLCPIKNRSDQELTKAYRILLGRAKATGLEVRKHVLDNECSNAMKELIRSECMLEVVTPHCHRRNIAEAAIKNFKNHFISILTGTDPNFPLKLWDTLLSQTELTLNLLRQSNAAPTISAQAICLDILISTECHLHRWDVQYRSTKKPAKEGLGHHIPQMGITWGLPPLQSPQNLW